MPQLEYVNHLLFWIEIWFAVFFIWFEAATAIAHRAYHRRRR